MIRVQYVRVGIVTLLIVGAAVVWYQSNGPVAAISQSVEAQTQSQSLEAHTVATIPALQARASRLQEGMRGIVTHATLPALLRYLEYIGKRREVTIEAVKIASATPAPIAVVTPQPPPSAGNQASFIPAPTPRHTPSSIIKEALTLTVSGRYRNVLLAIADISRGPVLVDVTALPDIRTGSAGVTATVPATLLQVSLPVETTR